MRLLHKTYEKDCFALQVSLNPYYTGNEVVAVMINYHNEKANSLNPYSTGNEVVAKKSKLL